MSSITDNKIAPGEVTQVFVQRQDDRLHGTPTQNKKVFDEYPDLIRYKHNAALDAIEAKFALNDADIEALKQVDAGAASESARASAESASESAQTTSELLGRVISISNKRYVKDWDITDEQDEFEFTATDYTYNDSDTYEVFVNGLKLESSEFTQDENVVTLNDAISGAGNTVEIIVTTNLKGKGIADTELNDDYTLTINYDDGTSTTTESIRGEKGEKGDKGDEYDDTKVKTDIGVLDARMDTFTHLAEGSTTGDAELTDIRVGADGTTYASAGGSVRGQIGDINDDIYGESAVLWEKGIMTASGTNGGGNGATSNIIKGARRIVLSAICKSVILIYSGDEYLGKLNASGGIDKQGGNWKYFTGNINIGNLTKEFGGDSFIISVIPTDSTTITDANVQTYGDANCQIISAYGKDDLDAMFESKQDAICKNLIGMQDGELYPVDGLEVGTVLTMSTSDGENMDYGTDGSGQFVQLGFYDENKQKITYWSFPSNTPVRTITLGATSGAGAKYLSWLHSPRTALQLEFCAKHTEYVPYFEPNVVLTKRIDELQQTHSIVELHKQDKNEVYAFKRHYGETSANNEFKAMWVSDIHNESKRTERMVELLNAWGGDYFDIAINTGDTVLTLYSQDISWYNDAIAMSSIPVLNTVGNHDAWLALTGELADKKDVYTKFIAPVATDTIIVQPSDASTNGYNYYYKDVNGVRVVVLDCMYWDSTQLSWFESVLADARANSLSVIACSHAPFAQTYCELLESVWNVGWFHRDGTAMNVAAAQAVKDFMDAGGSFICWLQGHIHGDEFEILPNYGNQLALCINSFQDRGTTVVKNTDKSAYNYDCLTYVTVDRNNTLIKIYRIGADIDTVGHKRKGFVWDYAYKRVVTEW